jgi:hypothetical protein
MSSLVFRQGSSPDLEKLASSPEDKWLSENISPLESIKSRKFSQGSDKINVGTHKPSTGSVVSVFGHSPSLLGAAPP